MTAANAPITAVDLPFTSLEEMQASLRLLLCSDGIFIETQYPPPLETRIKLILRVGPDKRDIGQLTTHVIGHAAKNPELVGKRGVQLVFDEINADGQRLLSDFPIVDRRFLAHPASAEVSDVLALDEAQILNTPLPSPAAHSDDESSDTTSRISDEEAQALRSMTQTIANKSADESLETDPLEHYLRKPEHTAGENEEIQITDKLDDFSNFQGAGGYEASDLILGIDLGTCNSCVSVMKNGEVKVIADEKGFRTTPSVVAYTEQGGVIVGREAQSLMTKNPRTCIFGAKRFIGRNYHSPVVQNMISYFPYKVLPDEKNHTAIDIFGKPISLEAVSSEILKHMANIAHHAINEEANKVIITVPAYYSDNQRAAVKEAGVLAGLNVVRIVNEPTAAAIAVGFNQKMNKRLLVFDLGGGTFDVSILEIKDDTFRVIATGGDTFLGGEDFDLRLVKWVMDTSREEGVSLAKNPITFERLKQACEKAKRELSEKRDSSVNLPYIQTSDGKTMNFQKRIDREQLVHLTRDLVEKSLKICDGVIAEAKLTMAEIDELVLVGGMTRMPFVRNSVHHHYNKKPFGDVNPDEAVAMGAAILGGEMTGTKPVALVDVLSMPIGIALPKNRFKPILAKNSQVPCSKKYKISANLDSEFNIDIFQGDSQKCDENEYLGTLVFSDDVKGSAMQTLEIEFALSAECLLNCTIRNPSTGKAEKALLMTNDTPPSAKLM